MIGLELKDFYPMDVWVSDGKPRHPLTAIINYMTVLNQLFQTPFNDEHIRLFNKFNKLLAQTSFFQQNNLFQLQRKQEATEEKLKETASNQEESTTSSVSQIEDMILSSNVVEVSKENYALLLIKTSTEDEEKKIGLPEESYTYIQESLNRFIKEIEGANQDDSCDDKTMVEIIDGLRTLKIKHKIPEKKNITEEESTNDKDKERDKADPTEESNLREFIMYINPFYVFKLFYIFVSCIYFRQSSIF